MKVFLVGGLGFIGRRFIERFSGTHDLVVYAKKESMNGRKEYCQSKNIILEEGTIEDRYLVEAVTKHKPQVVIHLAASSLPNTCQDNPDASFRTNVFGTYNAVNACVSAPAKLVFASSRAVYGTTAANEASNEDDLLRPNNVYGTTKVLGETLVRQAGLTDDLDYTILRLTNVYGPEGNKGVIHTMVKNAIRTGEIQIWGGTQHINFVFVDDVVELLGTVLEGKRSSNQTFNVGSQDTMSIDDLAARMSRIIGGNIRMKRTPMRSGDTANFVPDLRKAREVLGFDAKTSFEEGMKKTVEWYTHRMRR